MTAPPDGKYSPPDARKAVSHERGDEQTPQPSPAQPSSHAHASSVLFVSLIALILKFLLSRNPIILQPSPSSVGVRAERRAMMELPPDPGPTVMLAFCRGRGLEKAFPPHCGSAQMLPPKPGGQTQRAEASR